MRGKIEDGEGRGVRVRVRVRGNGRSEGEWEEKSKKRRGKESVEKDKLGRVLKCIFADATLRR